MIFEKFKPYYAGDENDSIDVAKRLFNNILVEFDLLIIK